MDINKNAYRQVGDQSGACTELGTQPRGGQRS